MKLEQQIPLLLVERQALNEAREGDKNVKTYLELFFGCFALSTQLILKGK